MAKRKQYDDEFRASAVLMLEAQGYPTKKGALTAVANHLNVPARTLSRWFNREQNPPPDRIVSEKRGELVERLESVAHQILDVLPESLDEASTQQLATALGILLDKRQLLSNKPTEITESIATGAKEQLAQQFNRLATARPEGKGSEYAH